MKITKMTPYRVAPRWVFVKLETDAGIDGWGEPSLEGQPNAVIGALNDMESRIIGADPTKIERLWQVLYRGMFYRGGAVTVSAISGIDHACWDILGKSLGVSIHQLLGGAVRDKIRMYKGVGGETAEQLVENAQAQIAAGFTAIKTVPVGPTDLVDGVDVIKKCIKTVETLRAALPDEIDIALDMHGRLSPAMARVLCDALRDVRPFFIEEPILPEHPSALAELKKTTPIPLATGERLFTKWGFRDVIETDAVAIVQPDLSHCGGLTEARKIAALAEAHFVSVAPHNPLGPLSTAACLQFDAAAPNFLIQETGSLGDGGYLKEPFVLDADGTIAVSDKPGLGVEIDEEFVKANTYETWVNPLFETADGFVTEW